MSRLDELGARSWLTGSVMVATATATATAIVTATAIAIVTVTATEYGGDRHRTAFDQVLA